MFGNATLVSAKLDMGYSFDGVGDYIKVNDSNLLSALSKVTVSHWTYVMDPACSDNYCSTIFKGNIGSATDQSYGEYFSTDGNTLRFRITGSANQQQNTVPTIPFNQWFYYTGTFNGTNISSYVNGQLLSTNPLSASAIKDLSYPLFIGSSASGNTPFTYFIGSLDEMTMWNRSLSESEIISLYNLGVSPVSNTSLFSIDYGTTNFTGEDNLSSVPAMRLATSHSNVTWNNNINVSDQDYDTNIKMDSNFISINVSSLSQTINSSANISFQISGCNVYTIYHASGFHDNFDELKGNGTTCDEWSTPSCINIVCEDNVLSFTAEYFDGFAGEGDNAIPEFSDYLMMLALAVTACGFFTIRNKNL